MSKKQPTPYLKLLGPEKTQEQVFEVSSDEVLIGRSSDADFVVLIDRSVSRQHAKIVKKDKGYSIVDLKSTHGTFVNDERIEEKELQAGDQIRLGRLEVLFSSDEFAKGSETTAGDLRTSLAHLTSVLGSEKYSEYSDLEKIHFILDLQYQWGQQLSSDETFEHILRFALQTIGAEKGCVFRRQGDAFSFVVGLTAQDKVLSEAEFRSSQTVVAQVAGTGVPVFMTEGIKGDLARQESIVEMQLRALACLPLKGISAESDRPEVLGILYLDSTSIMGALSGLDEKILKKLAIEAGNVLEKVEMIKGFEERRKYEQGMVIAFETQRSLLPRSLPKFGNFSFEAHSEPTRHVGGDFYDFLQPTSQELIGILADVSGKGVPAALLSSMLQGALDMEFRMGVPPREALARVNSLLCERSPSNAFATLFLFSVDAQGKGEFVGAGHNPAYLFRAATGEIEELRSEGLILGAFDNASYNSRPLQFGPKDVLVIYSDGVTEATDT